MFMDELEHEDRKLNGLRRHPMHVRGEELVERLRLEADNEILTVDILRDRATRVRPTFTVPRKRQP